MMIQRSMYLFAQAQDFNTSHSHMLFSIGFRLVVQGNVFLVIFKKLFNLLLT